MANSLLTKFSSDENYIINIDKDFNITYVTFSVEIDKNKFNCITIDLIPYLKDYDTSKLKIKDFCILDNYIIMIMRYADNKNILFYIEFVNENKTNELDYGIIDSTIIKGFDDNEINLIFHIDENNFIFIFKDENNNDIITSILIPFNDQYVVNRELYKLYNT